MPFAFILKIVNDMEKIEINENFSQAFPIERR